MVPGVHDRVVSALLDSLRLLDWAFNGGDPLPCDDAADADGNNSVSALQIGRAHV